MIQKVLLGETDLIFVPRAYIVPIAYGGVTGFILGEWYLRLRKNTQLVEESEERLRTLINALPDFVIFKDGESRWQDANHSAKVSFGLEGQKFEGKNDLDLALTIPAVKNVFEWYHATDEDAWKSGDVFRCEANILIQASSRIFDIIKVPVYWPDGGRKGMVIVGRDITGIKMSEKSLIEAYDSTLEGWSKAVEMRDKSTEDHTRRALELTEQLARVLGVPQEEMVHLRRGVMLHDVGKIAVPDAILRKPEALTPDEMEIMRQHPQRAYDMLAHIEFLKPALDIPYCHHERWDGHGYPRGLAGEQIPLPARIFAVIDVWDALTSDRPYRPAWSNASALDYIREQSGRYFDPAVAAAFLELFDSRNPPPVP